MACSCRPELNNWTQLVRIALLATCICISEVGAIVLPTVRPTRWSSFLVNSSFVSDRCAAKYACGLNRGDISECSCNPSCDLFDSCCTDQRQPNWTELVLAGNSYACASMQYPTGGALSSVIDVYVMNNCPSSFAGSILTPLCHHPLDQTENGTLSVFVTDPSTGLTYRNIYCAFCNGMTVNDVPSWNSEYYCDGHPSGSYQQEAAASSDSSRCIVVQTPPASTASLPDCRPNLIDSCPGTAPSDLAYDCAHGPTAYVYNQDLKVVYRNWNCAMCYEPAESMLSCNIWQQPVFANDQAFFTLPATNVPNYRCPNALTPSMSAEEQAAWRSVCPGIRTASLCRERKL